MSQDGNITTNDTSPTGGTSTTDWDMIGLIVGIAVGFSAVVLVMFVVFCYKIRKLRAPDEPEPGTPKDENRWNTFPGVYRRNQSSAIIKPRPMSNPGTMGLHTLPSGTANPLSANLPPPIKTKPQNASPSVTRNTLPSAARERTPTMRSMPPLCLNDDVFDTAVGDNGLGPDDEDNLAIVRRDRYESFFGVNEKTDSTMALATPEATTPSRARKLTSEFGSFFSRKSKKDRPNSDSPQTEAAPAGGQAHLTALSADAQLPTEPGLTNLNGTTIGEPSIGANQPSVSEGGKNKPVKADIEPDYALPMANVNPSSKQPAGKLSKPHDRASGSCAGDGHTEVTDDYAEVDMSKQTNRRPSMSMDDGTATAQPDTATQPTSVAPLGQGEQIMKPASGVPSDFHPREDPSKVVTDDYAEVDMSLKTNRRPTMSTENAVTGTADSGMGENPDAPTIVSSEGDHLGTEGGESVILDYAEVNMSKKTNKRPSMSSFDDTATAKPDTATQPTSTVPLSQEVRPVKPASGVRSDVHPREDPRKAVTDDYAEVDMSLKTNRRPTVSTENEVTDTSDSDLSKNPDAPKIFRSESDRPGAEGGESLTRDYAEVDMSKKTSRRPAGPSRSTSDSPDGNTAGESFRAQQTGEEIVHSFDVKDAHPVPKPVNEDYAAIENFSTRQGGSKPAQTATNTAAADSSSKDFHPYAEPGFQYTPPSRQTSTEQCQRGRGEVSEDPDYADLELLEPSAKPESPYSEPAFPAAGSSTGSNKPAVRQAPENNPYAEIRTGKTTPQPETALDGLGGSGTPKVVPPEELDSDSSTSPYAKPVFSMASQRPNPPANAVDNTVAKHGENVTAADGSKTGVYAKLEFEQSPPDTVRKNDGSKSVTYSTIDHRLSCESTDVSMAHDEDSDEKGIVV